MAGRCAGKLALVTGAAQGLGAAHARRLAEEGARVLCTDINGEGAAATAEAIVHDLGAGAAFSCAHDVTDPDQWDRALATARSELGASTSWSTTPGSASAAISRAAISRTGGAASR